MPALFVCATSASLDAAHIGAARGAAQAAPVKRAALPEVVIGFAVGHAGVVVPAHLMVGLVTVSAGQTLVLTEWSRCRRERPVSKMSPVPRPDLLLALEQA